MGSRTNIIAGAVRIYTAPTGEALPELDDEDDGDLTFAGNWVLAGFSNEEGIDVEYTPTIEYKRVAEHLGPLKGVIIEEELKFSFQVAERDIDAFVLAIGASSKTTTAAAADQSGQDILNLGDGSLTEIALALYGENLSPEGYFRVWHAPLVVKSATVTNKDNKTFNDIPVEFTVLCDPTGTAGQRMVRVYDMTAVPTS